MTTGEKMEEMEQIVYRLSVLVSEADKEIEALKDEMKGMIE